MLILMSLLSQAELAFFKLSVTVYIDFTVSQCQIQLTEQL